MLLSGVLDHLGLFSALGGSSRARQVSCDLPCQIPFNHSILLSPLQVLVLLIFSF